MKIKLYSYYRSSAAYRVRIGLNVKQVGYTTVPVNLLKNEHRSADYLEKQPQGLVPCLELQDGRVLTQSGAILNYLEEVCVTPKWLPTCPLDAAKVRAFVDIIACDIHPICNLRVLNYLTNNLDVCNEDKMVWYRYWIALGFAALESMLTNTTYCFGDEITLADVYLIPQVYNALRFEQDMQEYPKILAVYERCNQLDAFIQAKPENQMDAV